MSQTIKANKVGILLPHLGPSQLAFYTINQINYLLNQDNKYDFIIFFEQLVKQCIMPNCATMHTNDLSGFEGILISTNINDAIACAKSVNKAKNVFYVWDLEWLRHQNNFLYNLEAYRNPNLELVARSLHHAQAIENYANRRVKAIIPEINLEEIVKLCQT